MPGLGFWTAVGAIATSLGVVMAMLKLYIEVKTAQEDARVAQEGVAVLGNLVEAYEQERRGAVQIEKERLELERQKQEWEKWKGLAKAAKFLMDEGEG